jgi:hypothetical protein
MVEAIGLALAGRAGARLAARLGLPVGRDTMLRRVRALPDPTSAWSGSWEWTTSRYGEGTSTAPC